MPWLRATGVAGGIVRRRPGGSSRQKFIILSWRHSRLGTHPQLHPLPPSRRRRPLRPQPCSIRRSHDERYEKRRVITNVVRGIHHQCWDWAISRAPRAAPSGLLCHVTRRQHCLCSTCVKFNTKYHTCRAKRQNPPHSCIHSLPSMYSGAWALLNAARV